MGGVRAAAVAAAAGGAGPTVRATAAGEWAAGQHLPDRGHVPAAGARESEGRALLSGRPHGRQSRRGADDRGLGAAAACVMRPLSAVERDLLAEGLEDVVGVWEVIRRVRQECPGLSAE